MAITGNKGEWSEIYVLLKLLGDGILYAGDSNLTKIRDLFYPIKQIQRTENKTEIIFSVLPDKIVKICRDNNINTVEADRFAREADKLLHIIRTSKGSSFSSDDTEQFMNEIACNPLKAKSTDKTDIKMIIHDMRTCTDPELGFSIKSYIGNNPTLLNPGKTTNFIYKITPALSADDVTEINNINSFSKVCDRCTAIRQKGSALSLLKPESEIFENNMILIDGNLPTIIGSMLSVRFLENIIKIKDLTDRMQQLNPLGYNTAHNHRFYEYKIKKFLTDCALGMMPATVWNGHLDANGGYIVVKEDGDIVCYHIYNRNEFEDYLFNNTRLDTASTTRYEFGSIEYTSEGDQIFKLNLQIRFI